MAIPCSGPISMSMIHDAVGNGSYSLRSLSAAAGFSTPDAMSEFYCYNPVTYNYYTTLVQNDPCTSTFRDIYRRSDNNYFYYLDGSSYILATGYWYSYAYYDYYYMLHYYDQYYISGSDLYVQGQTGSYCAPS